MSLGLTTSHKQQNIMITRVVLSCQGGGMKKSPQVGPGEPSRGFRHLRQVQLGLAQLALGQLVANTISDNLSFIIFYYCLFLFTYSMTHYSTISNIKYC